MNDATTPQPHHRADIQGLRAVAVLMVMVFHAGLPVPGGFTGVDVFFVISGYVITAMLMRERGTRGRISFSSFYLRRFKRLTPALAVMIVVVLLMSFLLLSPLGPQEIAAKTALGAMLLVANVVIASTTGGYFDAPAEINPLLNTWSLSVEEQFYLIFPGLLALTWYLARRYRRRLTLAIPVIAVVSLASFILAVIPGAAPLGFYSTLGRAWEFGIGAVAALVAARMSSGRLAVALGALGLVMLAASLWLVGPQTPFPGPWTLLPTVGALLVILAGTHPQNAVSRALSTRPLVAVGDVSYSLYLWHWPLIVFAGLRWPGSTWALVLAAALSVIPAVLSYRFVEQPLRRSMVAPRTLLVATLTPSVALGLLLWIGAANGFWSERISQYKTAVQTRSIATDLGCDEGIPPADLPGPCRWNSDAPGRPLVLLGDSNAAHFSEALIDASATLDRPLVIDTMTGCPFIDTPYTQASFIGNDERQCRRYLEQTMKWLEDQPPTTVVLSSSDRIWDNGSFRLLPDEVRGGTPEARERLEAALQDTVQRLQRAGHEVILVQTVPHFGAPGGKERQGYVWDPLSCTTFAILDGSCRQAFPLEVALSEHAASRAALERIAEETGATLIDLVGKVCDGDTCSTHQGDVVIYHDHSHVTVALSRELSPRFAEAIVAAEAGA